MADANELLELSTTVVVVGTEKALVNRLDAGTVGVKSTEATRRRLVGLQLSTANTGYVIGRIDQAPVITLDMALGHALDQVIPCDIPIAVGQSLTFTAQSSSGTAAVAVQCHIAIGG